MRGEGDALPPEGWRASWVGDENSYTQVWILSMPVNVSSLLPVRPYRAIQRICRCRRGQMERRKRCVLGGWSIVMGEMGGEVGWTYGTMQEVARGVQEKGRCICSVHWRWGRRVADRKVDP